MPHILVFSLKINLSFQAYRNFSKRVENLKKKLDELTKTLPSPVSSPDINAPSPSPESDIDLPDDNMHGKLILYCEMLLVDYKTTEELWKYYRLKGFTTPTTIVLHVHKIKRANNNYFPSRSLFLFQFSTKQIYQLISTVYVVFSYCSLIHRVLQTNRQVCVHGK